MWRSAQRSAVPEKSLVCAIGDIHGHADLLDRLMELMDREAAGAGAKALVRVFLGDYVDRGPDSAGVIEKLSRLQKDPNTVFLRGNHEQVLLEFLDSPRRYESWRDFGADQTLQSYNVAPPAFEDERAYTDVRDALVREMPAHHLAFLKSTTFSHTVGDYLFVHAGIRPGVFLSEQSSNDMMWIRDEFLNSTLQFEKIVVHGHTPRERPEIRSNRINVDTWAYKTGRLTALVLEGTQRRFLTASR
jgi:serine/threonine protein phosphatase 1